MNQNKLIEIIDKQPYTVDALVKKYSITKSQISKKLNQLVNYNLLYKLRLNFNHKPHSVYLSTKLNYYVCCYELDKEYFLLSFKKIKIEKLQPYLINCYILLNNEWKFLGKKIAINLEKMRI